MGFAWANADTSKADVFIWADWLDFFNSQWKEQELLIPLFLTQMQKDWNIISIPLH